TYTHMVEELDADERVTPVEAIEAACDEFTEAPEPASTVEADARTRTGDPIITRDRQGGQRGPSMSTRGQEMPARCTHCGGLLGIPEDGGGQGDVRGEYAGSDDDEDDVAGEDDGPRSQRRPSDHARRRRPGGAGHGPSE